MDDWKDEIIIQLHWQWVKNGEIIKTQMRAQRSIKSNKELRLFIKETQDNHPLPDGAQWMACTEKSRYFVWAACPGIPIKKGM